MKVAWCVMVWLMGSLVAGAEGTSTSVVVSGEVADLLSSGRDCLINGKMTEAQALFEKACSLDSTNNEAAFGLSAAYLELKRYEEALPLLEKLYREVPESPMVKNNLAWALLKVKDPAPTNAGRAVKLARGALLDVPSDFSIWNTLGEAYYATGQFEKGLSAAQSGLRLSLLAGVTNTPCRELVVRCRKAAGAASLGQDNARP
ncbi:MAG: tetratricopeptide repeat protein [bacterium]|jgi:tetratricopeptide (TPR) repeat protein